MYQYIHKLDQLKNIIKDAFLSLYEKIAPFSLETHLKAWIIILILTYSGCALAFPKNLLNKKICIEVNDKPVNDILKQLGELGGFQITYSIRQVDFERVLSLKIKDQPLQEILREIFPSKDYQFRVSGDSILIYEKKAEELKPKSKYTLSGYIKSQSTGESLIGATIYSSKDQLGATTNIYGFYSLTLPAGEKELIVSFVGFEKQFLSITLNKNRELDVELIENNILLQEVVVTEQEKLVKQNRMSTQKLSPRELKMNPPLLGEVDVLKTLQLLPGISAGTEGSSGIFVRGGSPDQNLILLDGVPVYNAAHLFGFFSVFNADAINQVEVVKGGFPARYGGRLSSVIDIYMKEGNNQKLKVAGSIGLIASKVTVEGPIKSDKTSIIISARRTFADLLARPIISLSSD